MPLTEYGNGHHWAVLASPALPGSLQTISCADPVAPDTGDLPAIRATVTLISAHVDN